MRHLSMKMDTQKWSHLVLGGCRTLPNIRIELVNNVISIAIQEWENIGTTQIHQAHCLDGFYGTNLPFGTPLLTFGNDLNYKYLYNVLY